MFCPFRCLPRSVAVLAFTIAALGSACGSSHMIQRETKPAISAQPGRATLLIIRTTSFGWGITMSDYLDGKMIGQTRGRCFFMTDVPLGPHYVVADAENKAVAKLNFQAGRIYALSQGVYPGIWSARTGFSAMTAADARKEMADSSCDYREYNTAKPGKDLDPKDYKEAVDDFEEEAKKEPGRHKDTLEYQGFDSL